MQWAIKEIQQLKEHYTELQIQLTALREVVNALDTELHVLTGLYQAKQGINQRPCQKDE